VRSNVAAVTVNAPAQVTSSEISPVNTLKAWVNGGNLHVTGLTAGKTLSVYNAAGVMIYQSVVTSDTVIIPLKSQGVYIIRQDDRTLKIQSYLSI